MTSVEVEFKNLLHQHEFQQIKAAYPFAPSFLQANYYYDTAAHQLHQQHCGLRIRIYQDHAEQTLKVPATITTAAHHELVEITDPLTVGQARALTATQTIATTGQVAAALQERKLPTTTLQIIAQGVTQRRIALLPAGQLTLDQTTYPNGQQDFELELETTEIAVAEPFYHQLLQRFSVPQRPVVNKVMRAISQL